MRLLCVLMALCACASAADFGVVSFKQILEDSKVGKEKQSSLEALRNQISSQMEQMENEFRSLQQKRSDPDYMDSLSPEAEEQLEMNLQQLAMQAQNMQQQGYQVLSQAEYKAIEEVKNHVMRAAQMVAKEKGLSSVASDEAFFYYEPGMDVTAAVLKLMDQRFDKGES